MVLTLIGFLYMVLVDYAERYLNDVRIKLLSLSGGLLSVVSVFLAREIYPTNYIVYILALIRNAYGLWRIKNINHIVLGSAAVILSLFIYGTAQIGHSGYVLILAAIFYLFIYLILTHKDEFKNFYLAISLVLFPAGVYFLLRDYMVDAPSTAIILCAFGFAYIFLMETLRKYWDATSIEILSVIGGFLSFIGIFLVFNLPSKVSS